ncbi:MAG TPA: bifunctional 2-C-methyl-D-erythritol 4-phosphate cytidylyltransferase/2-C-methyl-D-erythritol 2,4-cyclodiphosphate synthase [Caulobacteraceae bacterium]|nr:bifunctional 2-C-methyl-D-erythritol 4-phosphate cytidylyltransferase/2-C-methyl-D-erythritol 2,4-cyclodiphosphate synthase [Caulobacteraceae bacterium]
MSFGAVIVAAGAGVRAGGPKQWRLLAGKPLVRWSVEALLAAGARPLVVVIPAGEETRLAEALAGLSGWRAAVGGAVRFRSVASGLDALGLPDGSLVLVHDAARPFVARAHVDRLLAALDTADCALPALPLADTVKRVVDGRVTTVDRTGLWRAQTPQAFRFGVLRRAFEQWRGASEPTDDAAIVEAAGGKIALVPGDPMLLKLTHAEDFGMAEQLAGAARTIRVGQGYDVHRFGPGEAVWLCGVRVSHDRGLVGHSDADAGLHALTDAILGALAAGDIGDHFPPGEPGWKDAPSAMFVEHSVALASARGGRVIGADITLVCEAPRIGPHRTAMRERVAQLLGANIDSVSIKATTTEGLGFTGRGEGLAAMAVATVELPA